MHSLSSLDSIWGPSYEKKSFQNCLMLKKADPLQGFLSINRGSCKGATRGNRGSAAEQILFELLPCYHGGTTEGNYAVSCCKKVHPILLALLSFTTPCGPSRTDIQNGFVSRVLPLVGGPRGSPNPPASPAYRRSKPSFINSDARPC